MDSNQWETIVKELVELKTLMKTLTGNGQKGRIETIEERLRTHDRLIWITMGGAGVVGFGVRDLIARLFS